MILRRTVTAMPNDPKQELSKTNDDLENLISSTEIATLFLDKNLNIRRFTTHVLELFNLIPTDVGKPLAQISSYLDNKDYFQDIKAVLDTLVPVEKDVSITAENKWYTMRIIPYKTEENIFDGVVMTFFDITMRKKIELELQDSERKYHDAFNNAEFMKSLLMHDINNVLTVISMTIASLDRNNKSLTDEIIKSAHARIQEQVLRGASLVQNVRKIAEIQEHEVKAAPVKICDVIQETVAYVQRSSSAGTNVFELNTEGKESITVIGNEHLGSAFENIIINGLKYNTSEVKTIRIDVAEESVADSQMVKVSISDNWIGITEEMKELLTSDTDTFKRDTDGTRGLGIGLSLVKQIINRIGGKLVIENRVPGDRSKGTTVHVLFKAAMITE
jgi:signal transduction histidine kinase